MMDHRPVPGDNRDRPAGLPVRRLLGQVLVDGEFITHYDLDRALETQGRTNEMLGEVLVRMGVLDATDLMAALSVQGELASVKEAIRAASGVRLLLGELLLSARRITPAQLESALDEQKRTGEKLGAVLVRRRNIQEAELQAALAFQRNQGGESGTPSPFRLGEILVATGQITREQLDRALARQKRTRKKIGEVLVEAGDIVPHQVVGGLRIQRKLLTAALVATLSMASVASAEAGSPAAASATEGAARMEVTARVLPRTTVNVVKQLPELVITDRDIRNGYVEVSSASLLEVASNHPAGYVLVFEGVEWPIRALYVKGLGREVQIGAGGGFVPQPYTGRTLTMELGYRFVLSEDATPGRYPWPLLISARPF